MRSLLKTQALEAGLHAIAGDSWFNSQSSVSSEKKIYLQLRLARVDRRPFLRSVRRVCLGRVLGRKPVHPVKKIGFIQKSSEDTDHPQPTGL